MRRAAYGLCACLFLAACGGGGGNSPPSGEPPPSASNPPGSSGSPNQPTGTLPTFGATTTALTFSAPIPNHTPDAQRIPITISGDTSGKLYVLASVSDSSVVSASVSVNQSGATPTVDVFANPAPASGLFPRSYSSTITLTACVDDETCQKGQLPGSPQTVNVTYAVTSEVQGDFIGPRVIMAGSTGSLYLRGRNLSKATQVSFGSTAATAVNVDIDTEIRASYPALTAGTYPISINGGAIAFAASLVVVPAPSYSATQLTYPSTPQEIGGVLYDAQRRAFYVAARYANSQGNMLFKYQFSNGAWQAPVSVPVPALQDVALSADGSTVFALTDNSLVEFNADSFARLGTYVPGDALIQAGTAYMQNVAVACDGYAIITTGGTNPSNTLQYSSLQHAFFTINSAQGNAFSAPVDPQLYFGNAGVSSNGAFVAISQDPRTATWLPSFTNEPFMHFYWAVEPQPYFGSPTSPYTDKDRSQAPRSARVAVNSLIGQADSIRIIVNGPATIVAGGDFASRGLLPDTTRAAAMKPDASRAYIFVAATGSDSGELRSYDIGARLSSSTQSYAQVGGGVAMSPGAGTGAVAMAITPDGGTLFVAGVAGVYVQPAGVF